MGGYGSGSQGGRATVEGCTSLLAFAAKRAMRPVLAAHRGRAFRPGEAMKAGPIRFAFRRGGRVEPWAAVAVSLELGPDRGRAGAPHPGAPRRAGARRGRGTSAWRWRPPPAASGARAGGGSARPPGGTRRSCTGRAAARASRPRHCRADAAARNAIHRVDRADPRSALVAAPGAVQIRGRRQGRSAAAVETKAMVRKSSSAGTAVDAAGIAGAAAHLAVGGGPDPNSRGPARPVTSRAVGSYTGTPAMSRDDAALERSGRPRRLLGAAAAGLGALVVAALFPGLSGHGLPHKPGRAGAVPMAAVWSVPNLYFHGPGGELLDLAPAGQRRS